MTAIETMKAELARAQAAQVECMDDEGIRVRSCYREKYQSLVQTTSDLKRLIDWLTALYSGK